MLQSYSYSWDKRLSGQYPVLLYQVQYGETDFAFIQRLMGEHGIYWFFEHSNKVHRMVLLDRGKFIISGTPDEMRNSPDPLVKQFITGSSERSPCSR